MCLVRLFCLCLGKFRVLVFKVKFMVMIDLVVSVGFFRGCWMFFCRCFRLIVSLVINWFILLWMVLWNVDVVFCCFLRSRWKRLLFLCMKFRKVLIETLIVLGLGLMCLWVLCSMCCRLRLILFSMVRFSFFILWKCL